MKDWMCPPSPTLSLKSSLRCGHEGLDVPSLPDHHCSLSEALINLTTNRQHHHRLQGKNMHTDRQADTCAHTLAHAYVHPPAHCYFKGLTYKDSQLHPTQYPLQLHPTQYPLLLLPPLPHTLMTQAPVYPLTHPRILIWPTPAGPSQQWQTTRTHLGLVHKQTHRKSAAAHVICGFNSTTTGELRKKNT